MKINIIKMVRDIIMFKLINFIKLHRTSQRFIDLE